MILNENELHKVTGGSINWTTISIIGTVISFIAGIVDGYLRPISCHKWF